MVKNNTIFSNKIENNLKKKNRKMIKTHHQKEEKEFY